MHDGHTSVAVPATLAPNSLLMVRGTEFRFRLGAVVTRGERCWGLAPVNAFGDLDHADIALVDGTADGRRIGVFRRGAIQDDLVFAPEEQNAAYEDVSRLIVGFDLDPHVMKSGLVETSVRWPNTVVKIGDALGTRVMAVDDNSREIGRVIASYFHFILKYGNSGAPGRYRLGLKVELSVDPELPAVGSMVIADSGAVLGLCIAARERIWVVSPLDAILERCRLKLWQPPEIKAFTLPRDNPGVVAEVVAQKADNWGIGEAKSQAMIDDARARASKLSLGAPPEDTKELEATMAMFNPDGSPREEAIFFQDGLLPFQVGAR